MKKMKKEKKIKEEMRKKKNNFHWLNTDSESAAKRLLGCFLERKIGNKILKVKIVETEAYDEEDEASHTFNGKTKRNSAMFLGAGHAYVYLTYGSHFCLNIVCGKEGYGAGVLIRAVEPVEGEKEMEKNRGVKGKEITNGPGKLCQALKINKDLFGHDLSVYPLKLIKNKAVSKDKIIETTRIGISKAKEEKRRFYIKGNIYVSKL